MISQERLDKFIDTTAWDKPYWIDIRALATNLDADGCSGVPDTFVWSCLEHDVHYRTHKFVYGAVITKREADYILRRRVQQTQMSILKWPISWIRWFGVAVIFRRVSQDAWDSFGGTTIGK